MKMRLRLCSVLFVLAITGTPPPGGVQAQQGIGAPSRGGGPTASAAAIEPEPYFQVTMTVEANGFSDVPGFREGSRIVTRRHVVVAANIIVRKLDNLPPPFGNQDNFPVDLTVTDDFDSLETDPLSACGEIREEHRYWSVRDPGRYNFGPEQGLYILPIQYADGTWVMENPFRSAYSNWGPFDHPFYYDSHFDIKMIDCGRGDSSSDDSGDNFHYIDALDYPEADRYIQGDQDGNVFTVSRQFTVDDPPSFETPLTVNWTFVARRLLDDDLTVERLEVTQGLQDRANSIPLVQDRRTVVRAYLGVGKDQVPIQGVTGELTGYSGNTPLGTISPFNGRITALPLPDWHQIDHTLNFELPLAWTEAPSLRLEVEVNNDRSVFETNYTNNKLSASVRTIACQGIGIAYVPVHYTPPGGFAPADPSANILVGQEFMRKIFPIPERGLNYFPWPGLTWTKSISAEVGADELLSELLQRLLKSSAPRPGRIFGWTPPLAFPGNGRGYQPGLAAFGNDTESPNRWRRTFAHEIGHTYGLSDNQTGGTGGLHWFDVYERTIKPPNAGGELFDVMNAGRLEPEAWISRASYLNLMSKLCAGSPAAQQAELPSATVNDNLIVSGMVGDGTTDITGTLDPLYRTTTAPTNVPPTGVPYCVTLKNAANGVLSQYCFSVGFDGDSDVPATAMPFGMVVPYPVGLNRIELTRGTTVLSSRMASTNLPTVTVTFPNAPGLSLSGVQNISWTGSDPDGDPLTYSVLYSRDNGATWIGVGDGISGNSYPLDFSSLPGGTSALVKVMVSDGFRSAEDVADNPFSVANKPPTTAIVSPPTGASFPANTMVTLQGIGADLEDGSLGDTALSWSSDKDGALGSGSVLEVSLSLGIHTITLTAHDSSGLTATATIICNAVSPAGSLGNIATRLRVETGDNVLIGGFIITGTQPKRVIVRAIGPSLTAAGVPGALANPTLELHGPSDLLIASNDNWMDAPNRQEIIDSTVAPTNDLESAILMTLPANNSAYTAIVRGVNDGTGVGLVEAYDLDRTVDSKLANIGTRGFVQTGDDVLIGGLIVLGQEPLRVIVRAIGPSLPVSGALGDPTLELHDGNGALLQSNDNWRTGGQEAEIIATTIQPSDDLESAIVRTLVPGDYTAIVRGVNSTTGIAVVEAYGLN
jgi:hypothetical protein